MGYVKLNYVDNNTFASVAWANQVSDNFTAILGSPDNMVKESLYNVSIRVDNFTGQFSSINTNVTQVQQDMAALQQDVSTKLNELETKVNTDLKDMNSSLDERFQEVFNNTGKKESLNEYFNNPSEDSRRNLALSINKLLDDLGFVADLTTVHKTTAVGAVNELDAEVGDLATLSDVNNMKQTTIVATLNKINELIGDLSTIFSTNTNLRGASVVEAVNKLDAMLGLFTDIAAQIKGVTYTETFNNINTILGNFSSINTQIKQADLATTLNKVNELLGTVANVVDPEITATNLVDIINNLKLKIGNIANMASVNVSNKGDSIEVILNKFDAMFGLFDDIESQIKGVTYTETFNNINKFLGNISSITDSEITAGNLSQIINNIKLKIGILSDISPVNVFNKSDSIVTTYNKLDAMLGLFTDVNAQIKGSTYTETFNKINSLLGTVSSISDTEITAADLSTIINNLKTKLGTVSNISTVNTANRSDSIVDTYNNLDTMLGLFTDVNSQIKGDTYTQTFNNINSLLGAVSSISDVEIKASDLSTILINLKNKLGVVDDISGVNIANKGASIVETYNNLDTMLGDFSLVNSDIKGNNYTETFNNIKTKIDTKNTELSNLIGTLSNIQAPYNGDSVETIITSLINKIDELELKNIELESFILTALPSTIEYELNSDTVTVGDTLEIPVTVETTWSARSLSEENVLVEKQDDKIILTGVKESSTPVNIEIKADSDLGSNLLSNRIFIKINVIV